jgi:hypothetical protein
MLTSIERITRVPTVDGFEFDVVLADENGKNQHSLRVTAGELKTYSAFCGAVLAKLGQMFGHEFYEGRGAAGNWRHDVDLHLSRIPAPAPEPAGIDHAAATVGEMENARARHREIEAMLAGGR